MTAKRIVLALILAGVFGSPATLRAQSNELAAGAQQLADQTASRDELLDLLDILDRLEEARAHRLEGSWAITVTPAPPPGVPAPPPFRVYGTFSRGGAFIGSDRRSPFGSPQHGTWANTGGGEFAYTFIQDLFDVSGDFQGTVKVRVTKITFTGKDELVGVSSAEVRDADGNITATRCGTIRGERITVEALPTQCQDIVPPR